MPAYSGCRIFPEAQIGTTVVIEMLASAVSVCAPDRGWAVVRGGFPPLMLHTVDFVSLYRQKNYHRHNRNRRLPASAFYPFELVLTYPL